MEQRQQQGPTRSDNANQTWRTPSYDNYRQHLTDSERRPTASQTQDVPTQPMQPQLQPQSQPYYSRNQDGLYDLTVSSAAPEQSTAATMPLDPDLQYRHAFAQRGFPSDPVAQDDARAPIAQYGQFQQEMEPLLQPFQAVPVHQYLGPSTPAVLQSRYLPVHHQQFQFMPHLSPQQEKHQEQQLQSQHFMSHQSQQQQQYQYQQQQHEQQSQPSNTTQPRNQREHDSGTSSGQSAYLHYPDGSTAQTDYRAQQPMLQAQQSGANSSTPASTRSSVLPEHSPGASCSWTFLTSGTYPTPVSAPQKIHTGQQSLNVVPETSQGDSAMGPATTSATNVSQSSAQQPAKKRIAQSACETCRRKRTKCIIEAGHIGCNVCRGFDIPCIFSGIDKRKESVRVLRARLGQLETLVGRLMSGNQQEAQVVLSTLRSEAAAVIVPEPGGGLATSVSGPLPSHHNGTSTTSRSSVASESFRNWAMNPSVAETRDSGLMDTEKETRSQEEIARGPRLRRDQNAFRDVTSSRGPKREIRELSGGEEHKGAMAVEDTLADLTDRLTIDDSGNLRAVPAASNLSFEPSHVSNSSSADRMPDISETAMSTDEVDLSSNITLGPGVELPEGTTEETVVHLLELYFTWEMPLHPVVSRLAFLRDLAKGQGPYYSSLLLNIVRNYEQTKMTLTQRGEHFYVMADDMLTEEIDGAIGPIRVPINTVQAIIVLVSRLLATGNELKAWMLLGTCARMALDLGLHLDARAFLLKPDQQARSSRLTEDDLYVRSRTFWGVWIFEQELCTIFGRPGILRDVVITCPYLESFSSRWSKMEDLDWWESAQAGHVITLDAEADPTDGVLYLWPIARQISSAFVHSMRLVYYDVALSSSDQGEERQSALNHTMKKTRQLARILPPMSGVFEQAPTHQQRPTTSFMLLYLHLLIRSHVILINRPFMSGSATHDMASNSPQSSPGEIGAAGDSPRVRCLRSAVDILSLLSKWRAISPGGLRTINITTAHILMSAAVIFLNEMTSALNSSTSHPRSDGADSDGTNRNYGGRFPLIDDYEARQKYGRERLVQDVLPLLRDMAQYRPVAQHMAERLQKAIREREELIRQHEARAGYTHSSTG